MTRIRESELYRPVRDWLIARGHQVHVEIFDADIVALKDGLMTAVELKSSVSNGLMLQLHHRAAWADYVFAAVAVCPKRTDQLRYCGYGLLLVSGGKVRQICMAREQPWRRVLARRYRLKRLMGRHPAMEHEVAGLPACGLLKEQRLRRLA